VDAATSFEFTIPSNGIVFGRGTSRQVGARTKGLGARRVMLTTDKQVRAADLVGPVEQSLREAGIEVTIFDEISTEPTFDAVHGGVRFLKGGDYDAIVALGGGSTIDSSKAFALLARNGGQFSDYTRESGFAGPLPSGVPVVALATTSGTGSDMTRGSGAIDPETGVKYWLVGSPKPAVAICDPDLTRSMPPHVTANTGTDALTQAVESYTSRAVHPIADTLNLEAIGLCGKYLRRAVANGDDMEARVAMMYAASALVGVGFGNKGLHAVHPIAQLVGDRWRIPHGRSLGMLLPQILEWSMNGCVERLGDVAEALGEDVSGLSPRAAAERGIEAIRQILVDVGTHEPLSTYGATEADLEKLAKERVGMLPPNPLWPRPSPTAEDLVGIWRKAL
jgi:alcohol dehydrogenase class IV